MARALYLWVKAQRLGTYLPYLALGWVGRQLARRPVRVAITGSEGKTTTKELVAAVLSTRGHVTCSCGTRNSSREVLRTLLHAHASDVAVVVEMGIFDPGSLNLPLRIFRPTIGVVTNVMRDHYTFYRGADGVALEKAKLVAALPAHGVAVLNADDPRVAAMAGQTRAPVVAFGVAAGADVRAEELRSAWPDTLSGIVVCDGQRLPFRSRLYGLHWAPGILAAVAVGRAVGIEPEEALRAVANVPPVPGRYSVTVSGGISFLRDDWKASLDSVPALLRFLRDARATRRILVLGTLSDYPGASGSKYRAVLREATAVADHVIVVGRGVLTDYDPNRDTRFARVEKARSLAELTERLHGLLAPGDLVVIKGSGAERLERVVLGWESGIRCWKPRCGGWLPCIACPHWRYGHPHRKGASGAGSRNC